MQNHCNSQTWVHQESERTVYFGHILSWSPEQFCRCHYSLPDFSSLISIGHKHTLTLSSSEEYGPLTIALEWLRVTKSEFRHQRTEENLLDRYPKLSSTEILQHAIIIIRNISPGWANKLTFLFDNLLPYLEILPLWKSLFLMKNKSVIFIY